MATLVGELIWVSRLELRQSEEETAERANISRNTLRRAERGEASVSAGVIWALCAHLGVALPVQTRARDLEEQIRIVRLRRQALPERIRKPKTDKVFDDF